MTLSVTSRRALVGVAALTGFLGLFGFSRQAASPPPELARWNQEARQVTITRDNWGIAHVRGKTDADAVFGMIYAQAEDDFNRIEVNYLNAMGRLAEAEGDTAIWSDLRMRLYISDDSLKSWYRQSPDWLQGLMNAWADGLNFFLAKHPEVKPRVLTRFEPWMALSFTEGSIGGDIERINLNQLKAFYGGGPSSQQDQGPRAEDSRPPLEPTGSNGIAIAPSNTTNHHALLLINPHTSFYFRSELQMTSDEGLNAYGAVTWGQFFIYQGFNEHAGWMHTSSGVDNIDEYLETVVQGAGGPVLSLRRERIPGLLTSPQVTVKYRTPSGLAERTFTTYRTIHGPVVRKADDKWVTVRLMQDPINALIQSYTRTKAHDYQEFRKTMELHTNSSNNTIFADSKGNIAYFHANFIPKRDPRFDWTRPVDGSDPATDWHGVLSIDESPNLLNPSTGWLYNSNNWPWSAAGTASPKRDAFPAYVERGMRKPARGYHALRVLANRKDFTIESLRAAAYDSYLPAFERMLPPLIAAWDAAPAGDPLKTQVSDQVALLRQLGLPMVGELDSHLARGLLGRGSGTPGHGRGPPGGSLGGDLRGHPGRPRGPPPGPRAPRRTSSPPISGPGERPGGTSTASSGSPAISCSPSMMPVPASRLASPRPAGVRSPRSAREPIPAPRSGTAPAATASSPSWSSATASTPSRSRPVG